MLAVWNWGAAASEDGGKTFDYLDPRNFEAGKASPLPFCCDQLAYYVPAQDLWIVTDAGGIERLIPAVPEIVAEVDIAAQRVVIRPPEGLLDL